MGAIVRLTALRSVGTSQCTITVFTMNRFTDAIVGELSRFLEEIDVARLSTTCDSMNAMLKRSLTSVEMDENHRIDYSSYTGLRSLTYPDTRSKRKSKHPPNLTSLQHAPSMSEVPPSVTNLSFRGGGAGQKLPGGLIRFSCSQVYFPKEFASNHYDSMAMNIENLESLALSAVRINLIPPNLTSLRLDCRRSIDEEVWNDLPHCLKIFHLRIDDKLKTRPRNLVSKLPPSLKEFRVVTGYDFQWIFEKDDQFLPGIENVLLSGDVIVEGSNGIDCKIFPNTLKTLTIFNADIVNLEQLPKSLTSFELDGSSAIDLGEENDLSKYLPEGILHLKPNSRRGLSMSSVPPSATFLSLFSHEGYSSQFTVNKLPVTLTHLESVHVSFDIVFNAVDFSHLVNLKKMKHFSIHDTSLVRAAEIRKIEIKFPDSLEYLSASGRLMINTVPKSLKTFKVEQAIVKLSPKITKGESDFDLTDLPASLTYLSIFAFIPTKDMLTMPNVRKIKFSELKGNAITTDYTVDVISKVFPGLTSVHDGCPLMLRQMLDGNRFICYE